MYKGIVSVLLGVIVGMSLYALGMPDPIPPIVSGIIVGTMSVVMRK